MSVLFDRPFQILNEEQSSKLFTYLLTASQVFGAGLVLLVVFWMGGYENGYAWSADPEKQFHYHPTLMSMGMIFLYGEAILVYRVFRKEKKRFTKLLHMTLHSLTIIFTIVSLRAVFNSHDYHKDPQGNLAPIPNLYSLHSWMGLTLVICYCLQFAVGFAAFLWPGFSMEFRQFLLPFHQVAGVIMFLCVSGIALSGISERAAWKHSCWTRDGEFCGQQAISNFFGIFIIGYVFTVLSLVLNPRWKRLPLDEEELLQRLSPE